MRIKIVSFKSQNLNFRMFEIKNSFNKKVVYVFKTEV